MKNLDFLFNPSSVAIIGASASKQKLGYAVVDNLVKYGYKGAIFPVNPRVDQIRELKCYPAVKDIPQTPELGVIVVPPSAVVGVAEECGRAGVKGLIVITAGFKETGSEGLKMEEELVDICNNYDMRMLGPNCVGLMDTHTPLNASFAGGFPDEGNISFISQSGAMLVSILDWSFQMGIGFSRFISLGNKADLNEIDFIQSCAADPLTDVILCYIEDVSDGDRFIKVCSEAARKKPIIILKSGTSDAGAQAAGSHTGALAGSDRAYDAAFRQCGVLRAETMSELFELGRAFSTQPIPADSRIALVTNAGGPAIIATDAVEKLGLKMARFTKKTIENFRENLPAEANIYNPVDIIGDARSDRFRFALEAALQDENVDGALVLFCPTAVAEPMETAKAVVELKENFSSKPVFAVYMGGETLAESSAYLNDNATPTFTFPEPSVRAMSGLVRYGDYSSRGTKIGPPQFDDLDRDAVRRILDQVKADRRVVLLGHETSSIMSHYGIPASAIKLAETEDDAVRISEEVGYPVAMKISSPSIMHKTDVGGVELGLHSEKEVRRAFRRILDKVRYFLPDAPIYGVEVQDMVDEGVEIIVGMSRDIQFGPLVVAGLGGIYVNLIEDVAFRLASALTGPEAFEEMIAETKAYTLLKGYRGKKPADIEALTGAVLRTARLVTDFSEIAEMDINPIRVHTRGVTALDVKITIESE